MDIDLLAKLVKDIILEKDEVTLPGVGTFVAETVPAAFSDKLFTINPPYRRLSFRQRQGSDDYLVKRYAETSGLGEDRAREILETFLFEMKEVLKVRKTIIFPSLGRLRATKENHFFFVGDDDQDIFPQGFGLEPVSLKAHDNSNVPHLDLVVPDTPKQEAKVSQPTNSGQSAAATEKVSALAEQAEASVEQASIATGQISSTTEPVKKPISKVTLVEKTPATIRKDKKKKAKWHTGTVILLSIIILCIVALASIAIIGRVAPDFIDQFLFTDEELQILRY